MLNFGIVLKIRNVIIGPSLKKRINFVENFNFLKFKNVLFAKVQCDFLNLFYNVIF